MWVSQYTWPTRWPATHGKFSGGHLWRLSVRYQDRVREARGRVPSPRPPRCFFLLEPDIRTMKDRLLNALMHLVCRLGFLEVVLFSFGCWVAILLVLFTVIATDS